MKKILIGFSGGIDSTAIAYSFINQGYEVIALTLIMYDSHEILIENAKKSANDLGIKLQIIDIRKEFNNRIIQYFINSYKIGMTPNPCAMCNRLIKFPMYNKYMKKFNCDFFSTGHYVKIDNSIIYKGADINKDQSYFISTVKKTHLKYFKNSINSNKDKNFIIKYLKENNLSAYKHKESQEICFIRTNYIDFLKENGVKDSKGFFKNEKNEIIGEHSGYFKYTIGKRKGLKKGFNKRMYVKKIIANENTVILSDKEHMKFNGMEIQLIEKFQDINNIDIENVIVKVRYRHKGVKVKNIQKKPFNKYFIEFCESIDSITPGQIAVFYNNSDNSVLMSGIILNSI